MKAGSAGEGLLTGLGAAFQQPAPAGPRWGSRAKGWPKRAHTYLCVLAQAGQAAGSGRAQPASSREFAHKSQFLKLLIPTSLVVSAAFSLQCWLFLALQLSFVPGAASEISDSRRRPGNNDVNRYESSETQRRTLKSQEM